MSVWIKLHKWSQTLFTFLFAMDSKGLTKIRAFLNILFLQGHLFLLLFKPHKHSFQTIILIRFWNRIWNVLMQRQMSQRLRCQKYFELTAKVLMSKKEEVLCQCHVGNYCKCTYLKKYRAALMGIFRSKLHEKYIK